MKQNEISRVTFVPLFPTWLFSRDYPHPESFNDELRQLAKTLRAKDPIGRIVSNRGGWQSNDLRTNPKVEPLIKFIHDTMQLIKKFLCVKEELDFSVKYCWMNINGFGSRNEVHIHGNAHFSGVYYVDVPEGSGEIEFKDPNSHLREAHSFEYQSNNPVNCTELRYSPNAGLLLIFPGYLPHEVVESHSKKERISVSFNVDACQAQ